MSEIPYVLYHHEISPFGQRVVIQLEAKGLAYEQIYPGEMRKTDAFDAISVLRKLPVLKVGDDHIPESEVICEYLEDMHPETSLRPADPLLRAQVRLLARIADLYVAPPLIFLTGQATKVERDAAQVTSSLTLMKQGLRWLDHHVAPATYAVDRRLSLADCALAPLLYFVALFVPKLNVEDPYHGLNGLKSYYDAVQDDPHVSKALSLMAAGLAERGIR